MNNISDKRLLLFILSILLLIPALLINLGLMPLIEDASIRALVAKEMILSGDYITPTMGGELYLKKPPVFNWMVAISMHIFNSGTEFVIRFPVIISLISFGATIFIFLKRNLNTNIAFLSAFGFITCGRVLLYESQKGLIDITFSWLVFIIFMVIYEYGKKNKMLSLFLSVWIITTITYFLKGLPALVFTGFTLLAFFIYKKRFLLIFNWRHIVSFIFFLLIFFGYYYIYYARNSFSLTELFGTLWTESTMRTPIQNTTRETILHILTFPFEYIFHFLPWTLTLFLLFWKKNRTAMLNKEFLKYCVIILLANIWVYWISPEIFARYLLMFVPLSYALGFFMLEKHIERNPSLEMGLRISMSLLIVLLAIAALIPLISDLRNYVKLLDTKSILISVTLFITAFLLFKSTKHYLWWMVVALLIARIGFNWFILPYRYDESVDNVTKQDTYAFARKTAGQKLYYYWPANENPNNFYYRKRITSYKIMYYLTDGRNEIIHHNSDLQSKAMYLISPSNIKDLPVDTIGFLPQLQTKHQTIIAKPFLKKRLIEE